MDSKKYLWIYSRKLAIYLQIQNCILQGVMEHPEDPRRKIFLFNDTKRIQQLVDKYQQDNNFQRYFDLIAKGDVSNGTRENKEIQVNTK
jgi:hypothetical protein